MSHIRPRFLTLAFTASLLLWASIAVTPASAEPVKINFSGMVTGGDLPLFQALGSPPTVSGSYTYESTSPLFDANATSVLWVNNTGITVITDTTINVGIYEATVLSPPSFNSASIGYTFGTTSTDHYAAFTSLEGPSVNTHPLPAGDAFSNFRFDADGVAGTYSGTTLVAPSISTLFFPPQFHLSFFTDLQSNNPTLRMLDGHLTSLALAPVPLPPAVILFGAGLLALVGLGAGNWRQKKSTFA